MRHYLKIILTGIILLTAADVCLANPLSKIFSVFKRDLTVNVLFRDHKNLIPGSDVFLTEALNEEKVRVGRVNRITVTDQSMSEVQLEIDGRYKNKIYETTPFVLISGFVSENGKPYVVAVASSTSTGETPMKSDRSVRGYSFLEYKVAVAGQEFNRILDSIKTRNSDLLNQLEQYIETLDTEAYQRKLNDLMEDISKFSTEQKEYFEKEILPPLRRAVESMIEKLREQASPEKSKELENQLKEIEKMLVT